MATETKIGLALMVLLVGVFGFVFYKKWDEHQKKSLAATDPVQVSEEELTADLGGEEGSTTAPPMDDGFGMPPADTPLTGVVDLDPPVVDDAFGTPPVQEMAPEDPFTSGDQLASATPTIPVSQTDEQTFDLFNPPANEPIDSPPAEPVDSEFDPVPEFDFAPVAEPAAPTVPPMAEPADIPTEVAEAPPAQFEFDPVVTEPTVDTAEEKLVPQEFADTDWSDTPADSPTVADVAPPQQESAPWDEPNFEPTAPPANEIAQQQPPVTPAPGFETSQDPPSLDFEPVEPVTEQDDPFATPQLPVAELEPQSTRPEDSTPAPFYPDQGLAAIHPEQSNIDPTAGTSGVTLGSPTAESEAGIPVYTVQKNDSYWRISKAIYGDARYYLALARFNAKRIPDPKRLRPGMKVLTPKAGVLHEQYPRLTPQDINGDTGEELANGFFINSSGEPAYRVAKNDTLTHIAKNHLGRASRWVQIYEMNRDVIKDVKSIRPGLVLRLPPDASRVRFARN
ncbi:LysM peptidoglycan-binding domain-containing protein [Calycomorphotria hydatis]|uniref:LysM domain/BON superfamily protein n=1 Tax=Calycomorphotria hydatis TaxID=2528027 RepID=A0A517T9D6_9PLAN|nr:LysM peptidoglycan-binding domain-containing protein [Calycomorphotria hydatis]QDT64991.1 LysM domain/BON superfamily protein [Calycomorphotria hydatis]